MQEFKWLVMLTLQMVTEDIALLKNHKNREQIKTRLNKNNKKINFQAHNSIFVNLKQINQKPYWNNAVNQDNSLKNLVDGNW